MGSGIKKTRKTDRSFLLVRTEKSGSNALFTLNIALSLTAIKLIETWISPKKSKNIE